MNRYEEQFKVYRNTHGNEFMPAFDIERMARC
jgi:hypothetical protein